MDSPTAEQFLPFQTEDTHADSMVLRVAESALRSLSNSRAQSVHGSPRGGPMTMNLSSGSVASGDNPSLPTRALVRLFLAVTFSGHRSFAIA